MELQIDFDPCEFLKRISPTLKSERSIHSFILSLTSRCVETAKPMTLMATGIRANGEIIAVGIQTESDRVLIISKISETEAREFAQLLSHEIDSLPGVNGPVPAVEAFAEKWTSLKSRSSKLCSNLRLFEIENVVNPKPSSGFARPASTEDRNILFEWLRAFHDEAVPHDPRLSDEDLYKSVDTGVNQGQLFVWEDSGRVVSLVGSRRETMTERWIAPVYTPPEIRGRGYASALTAYVSSKILSSGKTGMLFTDLSNPTSNSIYQNIGYKPVADFKHYSFL